MPTRRRASRQEENTAPRGLSRAVAKDHLHDGHSLPLDETEPLRVGRRSLLGYPNTKISLGSTTVHIAKSLLIKVGNDPRVFGQSRCRGLALAKVGDLELSTALKVVTPFRVGEQHDATIDEPVADGKVVALTGFSPPIVEYQDEALHPPTAFGQRQHQGINQLHQKLRRMDSLDRMTFRWHGYLFSLQIQKGRINSMTLRDVFGQGMLDRRWIMAAATTRSPKTSLRDIARDEAPFLRYPWGRFLSSSTRRSLFLVTLQFGKFDAQRRGRDRRATRFENIVSPFDSPLLFGPLRARFESYPQRYLTLSDELGPKSVRLWSQRAWYSKLGPPGCLRGRRVSL